MINLSTGAFSCDRANQQMGDLRSQANDLQNQVSTGARLSRSSDDPVAAARLRTLSVMSAWHPSIRRNSDLAERDLKLTDGALDSQSPYHHHPRKELATPKRPMARSALNNAPLSRRKSKAFATICFSWPMAAMPPAMHCLAGRHLAWLMRDRRRRQAYRDAGRQPD